MTCSSSLTWKFLWIVFSTVFMKPPLLLRPEHLWTQLRVWVSEDAELAPGNPRQHFEWKLVFCICLKARKKLPLPRHYFQDVTDRCVTGCTAAEQGQSLWPCSWEKQRHGVGPWSTLLYLVVPCCTLLCLAVTAPVTAPGLGCSLFIGKGERCSDAQQGDLCFRIYYISGRGGEEEKGRKRERRERFLAFQKRNQRHLAVISAEVHQISDRVCLTKKSRRVNGVTVSWACADRNSPRARPRTETRGQRLGSIQGPD